jgi:cystathionine beta-synthase
VFNDEWMAGFGFLRADGPVVGDVLGSRRDGVPELLYVQPHQTVREAAQVMSEYGVSQVPVAKNEMPLAAAEVMGSVSELRLMDLAFDTEAVLDKTVEDIMGPKLKTIGSGQPVALAVEMLETASALLVLDGGRPRAVISSSDVLSFLSKVTQHGG